MKMDSDTSFNNISAQIYLNKLREFSDSNLLTNEIGIDGILERTLMFIAQILPIDCAFVGEILNDGKEVNFKSVYGVNREDIFIRDGDVEVMNLLAENITVFDAHDIGSREIASYLLNGFSVLSGISVPIEGKLHPRGVLAVYSKSDFQFSSSKVHFVNSMANVIALFLQSSEMLPQVEHENADLVLDAKREWESTVDSLDRLFVVLDAGADIIRTNKTIQAWGLGTVGSHVGQHATRLIQNIVGDSAAAIIGNWEEQWAKLKNVSLLEWELVNQSEEKAYRFSLRTLAENDRPTGRKSRQAYAALVVDDITKFKILEKEVKQYTNKLEEDVKLRTAQLQNLNFQLEKELEEHKRNKMALMESEKRYARLIQNSLAGICTLTSGRIDYYNDRFAKILSAKDDELNNQLFIQIIVGEDRAKIFAAFAGLDQDKKPSDLLVVRATDKNKRTLWLEVKLDYLQLYNDNTILANIYDITQQKNIEISLRESEKRLHQLSSQLLTAQEVERKRIALDLHDGIGQSLSAIKYSIENIVRDAQHRENPQWLRDMDDVVQSIRGTIEDTRAMAMNLRPSILDDLGVVSAIRWCCNRFKETYKHIQVESDITVQESDIEDDKKIVIYRIIQESLNNVSKHSGATEVKVSLGHEDDLATCLRIADNGRGIEMNRQGSNYRNNGMGLNSIQERAQLTGGIFNLLSNRPTGTVIEVKWVSPHRFT